MKIFLNDPIEKILDSLKMAFFYTNKTNSTAKTKTEEPTIKIQKPDLP